MEPYSDQLSPGRTYGGPGVYSDDPQRDRIQLHRILSALCPHYSRSLSSPFPIRSISAIFTHALFPRYFRIVTTRFLFGTGRMPHPVGGAMGVTLCHCRERGYPALTSLIKYSVRQLRAGIAWLLYFDLDCLLGMAPSQLFYSSS